MIRFILGMIAVTALSVHATDFNITSNTRQILVEIKGFPIPQDLLEKNLPSGISNTLVAELFIVKNKKETITLKETLKIIYDLWDEEYKVHFIMKNEVNNPECVNIIKNKKEKFNEKVDRNVASKSSVDGLKDLKLKTIVEVIDLIKNYTFKFSLRDFKLNNENLRMKFKLILDPISKEKKLKIKSWLADNRIPTSSGPGSLLNGKSSVDLETLSLKAQGQLGVFNALLESELVKESNEGYWEYIIEFDPSRKKGGTIEK